MLNNRFIISLRTTFVLLVGVTVMLNFAVIPARAEAAAAKSSGILPLPDYSGDFFKRSHLLGDLGGKRTEWAKKGFTFDIDYNQYYQAVVDGGFDTDSHYGGTIDYNINIDFDRMGLIPGGLLQVRAVSRYGKSVNGISGAAIPVNTDATHPSTSDPDDDVGLYLPVINYTQFFSEKFAVSAGKFDTYSRPNEFAGGRGRSQWWNLNLALPTSPLLIVPYSVLGTAALIMPSPELTITGMVATSTDTSDRSGFDNLDDGLFGLLSLTNRYQIAHLPGGFGLMFGYGWDNDFEKINGGIDFRTGELTPTTEDSTWFGSVDFWQYLWVEDDTEQAVDPNNGRQDLQGVGLFSRVQFADKDTNPADILISFGVCAKGLIPKRDNDTMGVAFNYNHIQDLRLDQIVGIDSTSTLWELFYNIELTPAVHLTLDVQVSEPSLPDTDTTTILGTSLQMHF